MKKGSFSHIFHSYLKKGDLNLPGGTGNWFYMYTKYIEWLHIYFNVNDLQVGCVVLCI